MSFTTTVCIVGALLIQGDFHVPCVVVNIIKNIEPELLVPCARVRRHTDYDTATVNSCEVTVTARINPSGLLSSNYPLPIQSDQALICRHHTFFVHVEIKDKDSSLC
jgi:hypothetical protein